MIVMFDTSVLIAAFVKSHPKHSAAIHYFKKALDGKISVVVASHSIAECYAVLTRLPVVPKIAPKTAYHIISENIAKVGTLISITEKQYLFTLEKLSDLGLSGGIVYDAIILQAAHEAKAKKIITLNPKDFLRLCPNEENFIIEPT